LGCCGWLRHRRKADAFEVDWRDLRRDLDGLRVTLAR
jgi:hypothetical protein